MKAESNSPILTSRAAAGKYLTFALNGESFGIDVLKVREIIRTMSITAVPQMPPSVRGVINLRGRIIPVIDLRLRFEFSEAASTDHSCIIVVQVRNREGKDIFTGIMVDDVEEVLNIGEADIEETPSFGAGIAVDNIVGMAKVKGAVKALLNIDNVLGASQVMELQEALAS